MHYKLKLYIFSHKIRQNFYIFRSFLEHLQGVLTQIKHIYIEHKQSNRLNFFRKICKFYKFMVLATTKKFAVLLI